MSQILEDYKQTASLIDESERINISQPKSFRIPRAGARPLHFSGSEMAMGMSYTPELPYWYEINIYRAVPSCFVVAIRLFHSSESKKDTVEAWQSDTLDEIFAIIEQYDAAEDVQIPSADTSDTTPGAVAASQALKIHADIEAARSHYRGLAGEILYEIDAR